MVLPSNSTIRDLTRRTTLTHPESYVRRVLGNMHTCRKEHGSALVRIGVTGEGRQPHYWISPERPDRDEGSAIDIEDIDRFLDLARSQEWANNQSHFFLVYDGRNHERIEDWGFWEVRPEHWSRRQLTLEEVAALLGEIRQFRRRRGRNSN